jgi:hypothetical protein
MGYGIQRGKVKFAKYTIVPRTEVGWYDVINQHGEKINQYPLTSEEAKKLAKC